MRSRFPIAALAVAVALLGEGRASAYCRSSVCKVGDKSVHGKVCSPPADDDCGTVLQWRQPCVGFALEKNGSRQVPLAERNAWHFDYKAGPWIAEKTQDELWATIEGVVSRKLGRAVTLTRS